MKKILLILILINIGCNNKEDRTVETQEKENQELQKVKKIEKDLNNYVDDVLDVDAEKLALLSIIKKTSNDTLRMILKDYKDKTGFFIDDSAKVDKIIDTISQKYNISKVKIASIVFSYNYEVLTKDETEENTIEN